MPEINCEHELKIIAGVRFPVTCTLNTRTTDRETVSKEAIMITSTIGRNMVTADDFFTGFFAALAARGWRTVARRGQLFDQALAEAFADMSRAAAERDIDLGFRIRLNPIHGDSVAVRDGIANAVRRDLVSLDNPVYQMIRLKMSRDEGNRLLSDLRGGEEFYRQLVDKFLDHYENCS